MKATGKWSSVLVLAVSVSFVTPIGAQDPSSSPSLLAQRGQLAESILAAKERAFGESFDVSMRPSLKSRLEMLSMEQLEALAQQGESADIPLVLGSVTSDLVYTPVTPCRVFDSRVSQGGPGPILANTQRNVFVAGTVGFPLQGGFSGGCGIPVGATSAIINFVVISPSGPGDIRAWAVASPQPVAPLAAIINYGAVAGLPAIANGVAVPLCNPAATSCALGDLRLQADTSGTDILGDVVGYFGAAVGNFVDLTTAQIVGGSKTFSSPIVGDITGSAASVTGIVPIVNGGTGSATQNFVDLTTAQTVGGDKTLTGNLVLGASTATTGNIMKGVNRFIHDSGPGGNTFVGEFAGSFLLSGNNNTALGRAALTSTTSGSSNTAVGEGALNRNTSGITNTATGRNALFFNTTGGFNTAAGAGALQSNTTGSNNTATGRNALFANTVGSGNTATGVSALTNSISGVGNTADGMGALNNNSGGNSNTAAGQFALSTNTSGSFNTAVGNGALQTSTIANNNIGVGVNAGLNLTTGGFNIDIGNAGVAAESNTIRIGTSGTQTAAFIAGIRGVTTGVADGIAVLIDSTGQLGTVSSSRRFKDDIADMDGASSELMKLRPVTFHYKTDQDPSGRRLQYGLIAEEVAEVDQGLVARSADGQVETVLYQFLPPMLLNEVQKQRRMIQTQAAEIASLQQHVANITELLKTLSQAPAVTRASPAAGQPQP